MAPALEGAPWGIEERSAELLILHRRIFEKPAAAPAKAVSQPAPLDLDDQGLIEKARKSANGDAFSRLFDHGNWQAEYGSQSEADLALCSRLRFWTQADSSRMDRLFRQSALYREKWDKQHGELTYGAMTIQTALSGGGNVYSPGFVDSVDSLESTESQARNGRSPGTEKRSVELSSRSPSKIEFTLSSPHVDGKEGALVGEEEITPFPLDALPETLRNLAENVAPALPVPPDFLAVPMLVVCGGAIGRAYEIEVKRNSWIETTRLWAVPVGDPGTIKSPAFGIVSAPLFKRQSDLHREYQEAMERHRAAETAYKADLKAWNRRREQGDKLAEQPEEPKEPRKVHLATDDGTVEGVTRALSHNPRGIVFLRDELAGWVSGMNQFKNGGNDRQTWLSYWSGTPRNTVRAAAEEFHVEKPFVAVTGTIQPEVLGVLDDEQGRQDGFVHRILFSYPAKLPQSNPRDRFIDPLLVNAYTCLVGKLLKLGSEALGTVLPLSMEAEEHWNAWLDTHCDEMNAAEFSPALTGPWAKFRGYCATYALIIYVVRCIERGLEPGSVDAESVRMAVKVIDYHKSHTRRVYPLMKATEETLNVSRAVKWMQRTKRETITPRDLQRARLVDTADGGRKLLLAMEARGYGAVTEVQ